MIMTRWSWLLLLAVAGCSAGDNGEAAVGDPVALVTLAPVTLESVGESLQLYGVVENGPEAVDTLIAPLEARLRLIASPVGSQVEAGQLVLDMEAGPNTQLELGRARAEASNATQAYARAQRLRQDGLTSDAELESAFAAQTIATATLNSLEKRSGNLQLRAPFAGYVASLNVAPGDLVAAGTPVAVLVRKSGELRVRFAVVPDLARRLAPGARITLASQLELDVVSIDPVADPQTRLVSVYADLPADNRSTPGENVSADVTVSTAENALALPYGAVLDEAGQPFVYVVSDNIALRHDVVTGATDGVKIAITEGVNNGDLVVVGGATALEDGMQVREQ